MNNFVRRLSNSLPRPIRQRLSRHYSRFKNLIFKRAYYCKALSGESNYNICINSDLSVSCNCGDYDASGHIGNLKESSLKEIFSGNIAQGFRNALADGHMPIAACAGCMDLAVVPRDLALKKSQNWALPHKGIMVENTVVCNYQCLACDRGVVATRHREGGRSGGRLMSLQDIEIVAKTIKEHEIEMVCYHNLGEPFLSRDILQEMQIIRKYNPDTTMIVSTNGTFLDNESKLNAALLFDEIHFSIDGSRQDTVEIYQVGANFAKSIENMKTLVKFRDDRRLAKPKIEWKYVVFEWNDSEAEIEEAINLAREINADIISFWRGGMPDGKGESSRFDHSTFFKELGQASWKGREVILRKPSEKSRIGSPQEKVHPIPLQIKT